MMLDPQSEMLNMARTRHLRLIYTIQTSQGCQASLEQWYKTRASHEEPKRHRTVRTRAWSSRERRMSRCPVFISSSSADRQMEYSWTAALYKWDKRAVNPSTLWIRIYGNFHFHTTLCFPTSSQKCQNCFAD